MSETFLSGRVIAEQPQTGFRSGLDAVMLAASVPAAAGQQALELGAGAGTASLCLAARLPQIHVTGVEIVPEVTALAHANAAANGVAKRVRFISADIFAMPQELRRDFDHVFVNPPFHGEGLASPDAARAGALMDNGKLTDWLRLGLQRTISGGFFTTIIRADRMPEALAVLPLTGISIFPLWSRAGKAARRTILQVRKGAGTPAALLAGLVLHREDGSWTAEAEAILRDGAPLALQNPHL